MCSTEETLNPIVPKSLKRFWPRQLPKNIEAVTPPVSTSVAKTSTAPLLKDFFAGRVHLELLDFPELNTKDEVNEVNHLHERIKHAILQIDSSKIDRENRLPYEVLPHLALHGLFGIQVDPGFGGQGLSYTKAARVWESAALDGAVFALLDSHNSLSLQTLSLAGNEEQKRQYLPGLVSGRHVAAFCLHEISSGCDLEALTTTAVPTDDGQTFVLNGQKTWVTNGAIATHLIVFTRLVSEDQNNPTFSAFLVERNSPGIESTDVLETLGLHGANVTNLQFNNVKVPASNLLGQPGFAIELANTVFNHERLNLATACTGLLRYLLSYATEHALARHQFGRPLGDYELVQSKLAEIALNVYTMEAGVFYITGLLDAQPKRDLSLEIAALKVFCSEALWSGVNHCIQLSGCFGLLKDVPFERYLRDSRSLLIHGTPNDLLRLQIAGSGMRHVGPDTQEMASKWRLSLFGITDIFTVSLKMWARRNGLLLHKAGAGPKVTEGGASTSLKNHLHPHLSWSAKRLAYMAQRFQSLSEAMIGSFGEESVDYQLSQGRMANCAIDLLLLAIVLGRASRSISIGVHLNEFEVRLANSFARTVLNRVESNLKYLDTLDLDRQRIASEVLAHRGYPVSHPLTRVW